MTTIDLAASGTAGEQEVTGVDQASVLGWWSQARVGAECGCVCWGGGGGSSQERAPIGTTYVRRSGQARTPHKSARPCQVQVKFQ